MTGGIRRLWVLYVSTPLIVAFVLLSCGAIFLMGTLRTIEAVRILVVPPTATRAIPAVSSYTVPELRAALESGLHDGEAGPDGRWIELQGRVRGVSSNGARDDVLWLHGPDDRVAVACHLDSATQRTPEPGEAIIVLGVLHASGAGQELDPCFF